MFSDCSLSRLVLKPINGHKNTLVSRLQTSLRMCLTWCLLFSCYSLGISLLIFGCAHCSSCWLSSEEVYSKRNPFRTALTSPPLYICAWTRTSDNSSVHEIEPPSFLPLQQKEVGIFRAQFISPGFFSPLLWHNELCPENACFCLLAKHGLHKCPYFCQKNPRLSCWSLGSCLYARLGSFKSSHHLLVSTDQGQTKFNCRSHEVAYLKHNEKSDFDTLWETATLILHRGS